MPGRAGATSAALSGAPGGCPLQADCALVHRSFVMSALSRLVSASSLRPSPSTPSLACQSPVSPEAQLSYLKLLSPRPSPLVCWSSLSLLQSRPHYWDGSDLR